VRKKKITISEFIIRLISSIISPFFIFYIVAYSLQIHFGKSDSGNADFAYGILTIYILIPVFIIVTAIIWIPFILKWFKYRINNENGSGKNKITI